MKTSSTSWIRKERVFPRWPGWQDGYGAFTLSVKERGAVLKYIVNQEEHHRKITFMDEYRQLLTDAGIEYDEQYLV